MILYSEQFLRALIEDLKIFLSLPDSKLWWDGVAQNTTDDSRGKSKAIINRSL